MQCNAMAVVIASLVVEQHCVVYKICRAKSLGITTYFNRRMGTMTNSKCLILVEMCVAVILIVEFF